MTSAQDERFYLLMPPYFWGAFSIVLVSGSFGDPMRVDGVLQLERTGPFMPPVTMPETGSLVLSADAADEVRRQWPDSELLPVHKSKIVMIRWETWDRSNEDPFLIPCDGEPDSYILDGLHSEAASAGLGDLWELPLTEGADATFVKLGPGERDILIRSSTWNGADVFTVGRGIIVVSETGKKFFESVANEWLSFRELKSAD